MMKSKVLSAVGLALGVVLTAPAAFAQGAADNGRQDFQPYRPGYYQQPRYYQPPGYYGQPQYVDPRVARKQAQLDARRARKQAELDERVRRKYGYDPVYNRNGPPGYYQPAPQYYYPQPQPRYYW